MAASGPRSGPGQLLFRIVAYVALVVDALVIRAATQNPATFALALAGLIAATLAIANAALVMLNDAAGDDPNAAGRPGASDNAIPAPHESGIQVGEQSSRRKRRGRSRLPPMLLRPGPFPGLDGPTGTSPFGWASSSWRSSRPAIYALASRLRLPAPAIAEHVGDVTREAEEEEEELLMGAAPSRLTGAA